MRSFKAKNIQSSLIFAGKSFKPRHDVVDIFKSNNFFSVVDFDWEYPGGGGNASNASSSNDGANFALVLAQLRAELDALESQTGGNYEVSVATAVGSNIPGKQTTTNDSDAG